MSALGLQVKGVLKPVPPPPWLALMFPTLTMHVGPGGGASHRPAHLEEAIT